MSKIGDSSFEVVEMPQNPRSGGTGRGLAHTSQVRDIAEVGTPLRVIPRHRLQYTHTLIVNGEPHPISDQHVIELGGMFASVNQKNGVIENKGDRSCALVVALPAGRFSCINIDDPNAVPSDFGKSRRGGA